MNKKILLAMLALALSACDTLSAKDGNVSDSGADASFPPDYATTDGGMDVTDEMASDAGEDIANVSTVCMMGQCCFPTDSLLYGDDGFCIGSALFRNGSVMVLTRLVGPLTRPVSPIATAYVFFPLGRDQIVDTMIHRIRGDSNNILIIHPSFGSLGTDIVKLGFNDGDLPVTRTSWYQSLAEEERDAPHKVLVAVWWYRDDTDKTLINIKEVVIDLSLREFDKPIGSVRWMVDHVGRHTTPLWQ